MKHPFIPDIMFDSIHDITPDYLLSKGIRAVVLDIDNTLVTYGMPEPTAEVTNWIEALQAKGISVALASNNGRERVERFNKKLGVFTTYKSGKPSPRAVFALLWTFRRQAGGDSRNRRSDLYRRLLREACRRTCDSRHAASIR